MQDAGSYSFYIAYYSMQIEKIICMDIKIICIR